MREYCKRAERAGTPHDEALTWRWITQCALALKHCADRKVTHRDVKPDNLYLTMKKEI